MKNFITNPVQALVDETNAWQKSMRDSANASNTNKILDDAKTMYQSWLEVSDSKTKNSYLSGSNLNSLAWAIISYAETKWKYDEYASLKEPSQIVDKFLWKNPWRWYEEWINQFTGWKIWFDEVTKRIWINNRVNPYLLSEDADDEEFNPSILSDYDEEEWGIDWEVSQSSNLWKKIALIWWGSILWWLTAAYWAPSLWYWGWKLLSWWWKTLFDTTISTTEKEASLASKELWKQYWLEDDVKDAKNALKKAKKEWKWVRQAEEALSKATKNLENFNQKEKGKVVETRKTVFEPLWSDITRWRTAKQRAAVAENEWKKIYDDIINPLLDKYEKRKDLKIDLNKIFDEMAEDISKISYKDRRESLQKAFEEFKTKVSDKTKLSLREADTLKKDLWENVPKKYFDKLGRDVSSEWRQLEWDLWTKLRDEFHKLFTKEAWVDTAQKYLDYHNWMEYKKAQDKLAKEPLWKGSLNETVGKMWEWAAQKWWYYISKIWDKLKNASEKAYKTIVEWTYNTAKDLVSSIKKDPKSLIKMLKKWWKWLLDPVALIMPDFSPEWVEEYKNSEYWQKMERWFNDWVNKNFWEEITKDEWISLIWEDWYAMIDEDKIQSLEDKWWTKEWILMLLNSIE